MAEANSCSDQAFMTLMALEKLQKRGSNGITWERQKEWGPQ